MRKYLWGLCVVLGVMAAQEGAWARSEARCFPKGCLTEGWDDIFWNPGPVVVGRASCVDSNCMEKGWTYEGFSSPYQGAVTCDPQGCFASGWVEKSTKSGKILRRIQCETGGCLVKGWTAYFYAEQPPYVQVRCVNDDCAHAGWRITYPNGSWRRVQCLKNDCFGYGWESNP